MTSSTTLFSTAITPIATRQSRMQLVRSTYASLRKHEDCWTVLALTPKASQSEIREAYRRLILTHHPDKSRDPMAGERFDLIKKAYQQASGIRNELDFLKASHPISVLIIENGMELLHQQCRHPMAVTFMMCALTLSAFVLESVRNYFFPPKIEQATPPASARL